MAEKTAVEELELPPVEESTGGPGEGDRGRGGDGGDDGGRLPGGTPQGAYVTGIWLALASIVMFFTALLSAFIVRRGLSNDWMAYDWPRVLWANTAVLLASSTTLERARHFMKRAAPNGFRTWWGVTAALGLLFLAGQLAAWRQLTSESVYLATNPSSSFFYLLTGAHGLHLLGGLVALFYVGFREPQRVNRQTAVAAASIYWHFMGAVWVILFAAVMLG